MAFEPKVQISLQSCPNQPVHETVPWLAQLVPAGAALCFAHPPFASVFGTFHQMFTLSLEGPKSALSLGDPLEPRCYNFAIHAHLITTVSL